MIEPIEIKKLQNNYVAVGVPHEIIQGKLFFYFGTLKNIDDDEIKIEINNGYKIIPINQIMEIHGAEVQQ
jgi:hypothetical protein